MRIKNLHLENFRGFEKLDIEFPENSNVAVLIGENGAGKSSILNAVSKFINAYFRQIFRDTGADREEESAYFKITDYNNYNNLLPKINLQFIENSENLDLSIYLEGQKGSFLKKDKGGKINFNFLASYNNSGEKIEISPESFYIEQTNFYFNIGERNLFNSIYADCKSINLTDSNKTIKYFEEWFLSLENLELQTKVEKENFNFRLTELEIFRHFIKTFYNNLNDIKFDDLKGKREKGDNFFQSASNWIELKKANKSLRLNQLSSGEINLLMLVSDIVRRQILLFDLNQMPVFETKEEPTIENIQQSEGIVLIDEIELHLHPKWQRNILPALTKTFPNIQFIVTTHSPQVASSVPNNSIFVIEDFKLVEATQHTFGRDTNSLLWELFATTERPKETQELIAECAKLIVLEKYSEAQEKLDVLTAQLGEKDSDIISLQTELSYYLQENE